MRKLFLKKYFAPRRPLVIHTSSHSTFSRTDLQWSQIYIYCVCVCVCVCVLISVPCYTGVNTSIWFLTYKQHQLPCQVMSFLFFGGGGATAPQCARVSSFTRFLDHTQRRTTVGRTPLDEWSARHKDLYLTTHDNHNRGTSMPPVELEPIISARERPRTCALDRAAIGTGSRLLWCIEISSFFQFATPDDLKVSLLCNLLVLATFFMKKLFHTAIWISMMKFRALFCT